MILVGDFNENDFKNGIDKQEVEKKKTETGLNCVETKLIKKKGQQYIRIWVCTADEFTL